MSALPSASVKATAIAMLEDQNQEHQQILGRFQNETRRDFVFSLVHPDPLVRIHGIVRLHSDVNISDKLQRKIERAAARETTLRQSAGWIASAMLQSSDGKFEPSFIRARKAMRRASDAAGSGPDSRETAAKAVSAPPLARATMPRWTLFLLFVVSPMFVWVLWAFLLRGGLTFWLAGIALLHSTGRKALRIQCAWRALLIWTPVAAFLALSWFNEMRWADWFYGIGGWTSWLSEVCWSLALVLLPLYVGLALWFPNRSLHDRLAGTYLVPR
jgi:hypothetical protein